MKILLFKAGAIGDVIMTTPLVRQLRKSFPGAKIDYLVGNYASQVLEGNPNLDEIIKFDEKIFFRKNLPGLLGLASKIRKRRYDIILVMDKHWIFNLTAMLFGIRKRIGFDRLGKEGIFLTNRVYYGNDKHEIIYYLELLAAIGGGADFKDTGTELYLGEKDYAFAEGEMKKISSRKLIGISPGGGKNSGEETGVRNYPAEKYAYLAAKILEKNSGDSILLFGGPDDEKCEDEILKNMRQDLKKRVISFIGKTSIKQSAALIKKCEYFICNDTGSMHIASCTGTKIISIFGPTNPKRKAPLTKGSCSVWKDEDIYENDYELFGKAPKKGKKFFAKITPEDIMRLMK